MSIEPFKILIPNKDRIPAVDYNKIAELVVGMMNSSFPNGFIDHTGFHPTIQNIEENQNKTDIRRAKIVEDAPHDNVILANIFNIQGIEATEGDEYYVEIYCHISGFTGAGYLDEAVSRLVTGNIINVEKLPYNNEGTVEQRWYAQDTFQVSIDCICGA